MSYLRNCHIRELFIFKLAFIAKIYTAPMSQAMNKWVSATQPVCYQCCFCFPRAWGCSKLWCLPMPQHQLETQTKDNTNKRRRTVRAPYGVRTDCRSHLPIHQHWCVLLVTRALLAEKRAGLLRRRRKDWAKLSVTPNIPGGGLFGWLQDHLVALSHNTPLNLDCLNLVLNRS